MFNGPIFFVFPLVLVIQCEFTYFFSIVGCLCFLILCWRCLSLHQETAPRLVSSNGERVTAADSESCRGETRVPVARAGMGVHVDKPRCTILFSARLSLEPDPSSPYFNVILDGVNRGNLAKSSSIGFLLFELFFF